MDNLHLPEGKTLGNGKYRIIRFIGAGGFGCTYEAEFVEMKTHVAIKEFFVGSCCNRDASGIVYIGTQSQRGLVTKLEEKFQREACNIFKLQHPNIVRVSDIFRDNGTSYYVMEYISGSSLQTIIDLEGPLSEPRAQKYIGQVMDALEYVHSKTMLHLDIKPDNIMIDRESDRAILIDFGVSKQYDEIDGHNTSTIMGQTPGFAPPEQIGNNVKFFTPATDIYSLGATLYCALSGEAPPPCSDIMSGIAQLSPLPTIISPSIHQAINMMMQPNLNFRPQSITAVRRLFNNFNSSETQMVQPQIASSVGYNETIPVQQSLLNNEEYTEDDYDFIDEPQSSSKKTLWVIFSLIAILLIICIFFILKNSPAQQDYELTDSVDTINFEDAVIEPTYSYDLEPQPVEQTSEDRAITQRYKTRYDELHIADNHLMRADGKKIWYNPWNPLTNNGYDNKLYVYDSETDRVNTINLNHTSMADDEMEVVGMVEHDGIITIIMSENRNSNGWVDGTYVWQYDCYNNTWKALAEACSGAKFTNDYSTVEVNYATCINPDAPTYMMEYTYHYKTFRLY